VLAALAHSGNSQLAGHGRGNYELFVRQSAAPIIQREGVEIFLCFANTEPRVIRVEQIEYHLCVWGITNSLDWGSVPQINQLEAVLGDCLDAVEVRVRPSCAW
jgi:hypothetical protein